MTIEFVDGADHYATADIETKWTSKTSTPTISTSAGRRSSGCITGTSTAMGVSKTLSATQVKIVGFALNLSILPSSEVLLLQFLDSAVIHITVSILADGTLKLYRGPISGGTLLGTSLSALSTNAYNYMEVKVKIDDSVGTYEVKVNGTSVISGTGADTRNAGNATTNVVKFFGFTTMSLTWYLDDIYIANSSGSVNNDFLGDVRIDSYLPNGNGNSSQFVGSDSNSTDNYLLVDDTTPNGDTDYVQSSTVNDIDTYTFTDMTHTPSTIFGVQVLTYAKKDDAGARSLANVVRSGSTNYNQSTQTLSTSYTYYRDIVELDPNTSAQWVKANLNSAEFGITVIA